MIEIDTLKYGANDAERQKAEGKIPEIVGDRKLHSVVPIIGGSNGYVSVKKLLIFTESADE